MKRMCDDFEWFIGEPAEDEDHLPLRKIEDIPPINVKPKDGAGIRALNVSTEEPFKINQTPQTAADAAASGAVLKIRDASLRRNCTLNISYSTNSIDNESKCIFEIPTRVPIHTPGSNAQWKASDVRLERYVTMTSNGTKWKIPALVTWLRNVKEATIWLEGSSGSGKTTFIERFCETVTRTGTTIDEACGERQAHWCVVVLDGKRLCQPPENANVEILRNRIISEFFKEIEKYGSQENMTEKLSLDIVDENHEAALQDVVTRYQENRLLLVFEEFDVYFQRNEANAREILKYLRNEVVKRFVKGAKGGILVVVDQVAPSIRGFKRSNSLLGPFQHWKLNDYFTIEDVKEILGQLTPHASYDAAATRIWVWTRGQPTLVNSLIFQYVERIIERSSDTEENVHQAFVTLVDSLAYSDVTRGHVDYLVNQKRSSDGLSFDRLHREERDLIDELLEFGSVKVPDNKECLELLTKKGILEEAKSLEGDVSYRVAVPLIRLHLGSRHKKAVHTWRST